MKKNLSFFRVAILALGIFISTTASAAFTAVTSGNWSSSTTWGGPAPTSTVSAQDITIPTGITVTLDADVTFQGLVNSFIVNGTLSNTNSFGIVMAQGALSGNGTISVHHITFNTLSTASFAGTMNLKRLTNTSTALALVAIANIADTLDLSSGNIVLNTNANLTMMSNSNVKVGNGAVTVSGGIFNSGNAYNVMYVGSSKTSGIELNTTTLQHLYLYMSSSSQVVTLNNNLVVNGDVTMNPGKLAINGKQLTLKGNLTLVAGSNFQSTAASNLIIQGSGALSSNLMFDAGSNSINNITVNRASSGMVKLGSALTVNGYAYIMDGNFSIESGATLTMASASTFHVEKGAVALNGGTFNGTAAYNVEYMGNTNANSGMELTGSGLNNVTVNYSANSNKMVCSSHFTVAGQLNMTNGNLDLNGRNITLNGTFSSSSNSKFMGNPTSEFYLNLTTVGNDTLWFDAASQNNQTLSKLLVKTNGANSIVIGSKLWIATELNFTNGKIELANNDLIIMAAASVVGANDTRYVITSENASGSLVMNVAAGFPYVYYPIGTSQNYSPAFIQQAQTAASGTFAVKCMNIVYSNGTSGLVNSSNLKVVRRTWLLNSGVSSINANLKFGWAAAAEANGFDRTNAYISHYSNSAWDVMAASGSTVGANNTFELTRSNVTSLSPFTVTEANQPLGLIQNSSIANFEVYPNPSKDVIYVKPSNPGVEHKYQLVDLTGKTVSSTTNMNHSTKFDISGLEKGIYFMKVTNLEDNKTQISRFIKD